MELEDAVRTSLAEWETPFVELAIFGSSDPGVIARAIDDCCREVVGQPVASALFYGSSIGSVAGVALADGRRVVVKAHQPRVRPARLQAMQGAMTALAEAGFPCPRPLAAPVPLGNGHATLEALLDRGEPADAHDPAVRRELARRLAELVRVATTTGVFDRQALGGSWFAGVAQGRVFPEPHSRLFDFEATRAGAEWIDALAAEARRAPLVGDRVVGHFDWRVEHARFEGGSLVAAYDWDSLHCELEPIMVGANAHAFTADWTEEPRRDPRSGPAARPAPTEDEIRAFVADYEEARGRPFDAAERRLVAASCVYSIAYTARCGHALDPHASSPRDRAFRDLLRSAGRSLLDAP